MLVARDLDVVAQVQLRHDLCQRAPIVKNAGVGEQTESTTRRVVDDASSWNFVVLDVRRNNCASLQSLPCGVVAFRINLEFAVVLSLV